MRTAKRRERRNGHHDEREPWTYTRAEWEHLKDQIERESTLTQRMTRCMFVEQDDLLVNLRRNDHYVSSGMLEYVPKSAMTRSRVEIFRGAPAGATDIRPGDWVTLARRYAVLHARARYGRDAVVLKKTVAANEVAWAGTDWNEWFYVPLELRATGDYRTTHEAVVANAVARGLKVPRKVADEYPHIVAQPQRHARD